LAAATENDLGLVSDLNAMLGPRSICLVSPFAGPLLFGGQAAGGGGAERQLVLIGQLLAERGWQVSFVIRDEADGRATGSSADSRFQVYRVPFRYLGGSKRYLIPDLISLRRVLRANGASIVGLRCGGPYVLLGLLLHRLGAGKLVAWLQNDADLDSRHARGSYRGFAGAAMAHIYTVLLRRVDLLIAQTQNQYEAARRLHVRSTQLQQSVAASLRMPSVTAAEGRATESEILWAGNTTPNKRIGLVFDLAKRLPKHRFAIAINPGNSAFMTEAASAAGRIANVHLLGSVPPTKMENWFDRASLVLNTSLVEGFPNTFLQAWLRAVPVATAGVDPDGVVSKFGLGVVVPVKDGDAAAVERLAFAIRRMMSDDVLRRQCGQAGLEYVKAHHSPETIGRQLDEGLTNVLRQ
jgi:glycosyltransferase involved in cell wall biosynthesis